MAVGPIIVSENVQQQNGTVRTKKYEFTGDKAVKLFAVASDTDFNLTLLQGGTGGAFRLSPKSNYNFLPGGATVTFGVIYDSSLGTGVTASLYSSVPMYAYDSTGATLPNVLIGPTAPIDFVVINPEKVTSRGIGPLMAFNGDQDYIVTQSARKITEDETSFGLIRTNPKVTGNVKLTVDSANVVWMNSIDADKELANDRFKKVKVNPESSYAIDLFKFFDDGACPTEIVYTLFQEDPLYTTTKKSFSQQYDRFYQYGATQLNNKYYDEDFSFFAPLYLKEEVPDYFVIFRTEGPLNDFTYTESPDVWPAEFVEKIMRKSSIVKTYDLGANTKIGKYLRNIINHPSRRTSDLTISLEQNGYTTYNGISYRNGSFAEKGELLFDFYNQENPLSVTEEWITGGFQRNGVISSHIINLEFLFDDTEVEDYTINRYFGFYVNAIDLANFALNENGLQQFSQSVGQTPFPRKGVDGSRISTKSFTQTNPTGIRIYGDAESVQRLPERDLKTLFSSYSAIATGATSTFSVLLTGDWVSIGTLNVGDNVNFSIETVGVTASATVQNISVSEDVTEVTFDLSSFVSPSAFSLFLTYFPQGTVLEFFTSDKLVAYRDSIFDNSHISGKSHVMYVKDRLGNLYDVTATRNVFPQVRDFETEKVVEITLHKKTADITNFAGFTDILTQEIVTLLDSKGKSSLSFEVEDFFNANDSIEIRWSNFINAQPGYPLRWKIVANDSGLLPGENWANSSIDTDVDGEYYLTYFHPGDPSITIETFCQSLANAFNVFPYKNFEVLAKGKSLHFRCTQEGLVSEKEQLIFSNFTSAISVMGVTAVDSGTVDFVGASDRKRVRVKLAKDIALGMLPDEYVSTKGSYSLTSKYDILGTQIGFAPYVEEPVYDENGKLIDFVGVENNYAVILENEKQEIQITSDKKFTTYELFKPTFGVLSFMPIRDFDTDFYLSDYVKGYVPELAKYFARFSSPMKIINIVSSTTIVFDTAVNFPAVTNVPFIKISPSGEVEPVIFNSDAQLQFPGGTSTNATLLYANTYPNIAIGDTILLMPYDYVLYMGEEDLAKFKGFLSLIGLVSDSDEAEFRTLENQWDPSRFLLHLLNSEYDRMAENFLKTLVLRSRVVPYILKWVAPQGKDVRDNPYRFNYHRVFGNMNFSPSREIGSPDPRYLTHEWPYLDSVPSGFNVAKFPQSVFSYFFDKLDLSKYDFSSLKKDWFSEYFTVGYPTELYTLESGGTASLPVNYSERYSFFNFDPFVDKTFTLFRGQKMQINELDSNGEVVLASKKYDDYRFSVIMSCEEENPLQNEDSVTFQTYVNEKWKFIVTHIKVKTFSYRNPKGNLGYVDIYTLQNENDKVLYQYGTATAGGLSEYYFATPADRKLSSSIDFALYSSDSSLLSPINFFDSFVSPGADPVDIRQEIVTLSSGDFSHILGIYESGLFQISYFLPKVKSVYSNITVEMSSEPMYYVTSFTQPVASVLPFFIVGWNNALLFHSSGGNNSLEGIRDQISFFEISKVFDGSSSKNKMNYTVYAEDGSVSTTPNLSFGFISQNKLERVFDFVPVPDTDKPRELFSYPDIGYVLNEGKDLQTLYRYQGDFAPKFRDVVSFWMREDMPFTVAAGVDFLLHNTRFANDLPNFSTLRNQFYNKVSINEILRIAQDSAYKSVYPLVNEISIDKKDIYAWNSSWDNLYYRNYESVDSFAEVKGTEEMKEIKSFFASKMMRLPKSFDLFEYEAFQASNVRSFAVSDPNREFTYFEQPDKITIRVNVYRRLLRELLGTNVDLRAKKEFYDILNTLPGVFDPLTVDQRIVEYLEKNILPLYGINDVRFFFKQTGDPGIVNGSPRPVVETTEVNDIAYTLSEVALSQKGYVKKGDISLNNVGNLVFEITFPFDSRYYTSVSVGVNVRRI